MKTIGVEQSLCNRSSFEHNFLNDIKNIHQHAVKCDDQKKLKDVLDAAMVSTPEEITHYSHSLHMNQTTVKTSTSKSQCLFTSIFDVKNKTEKRRAGDAKSKLRAMKVGKSLWTN